MFIYYNRGMENQDHMRVLNRKELIAHAKVVLKSDIKGSRLAKEMEMNSRQVYAYRNNKRDIANAYYDNLLKFEAIYQKYFKEEGK